MKKLIMVGIVAVLSIGCASVPLEGVTLTEISGNKTDGVLVMGHVGKYVRQNQVNWLATNQAAANRCKLWGYASSEPFGVIQNTCLEMGGGVGAFASCSVGKSAIEYQCNALQ